MPESDSENFESADEDVDDEKTTKENQPKLSKANSQDQDESNKTSWRSWSAFGIISQASKSVASATTKMTQSLSTAIESINIPEPEELAKMNAEQKKKTVEDEEPVKEEEGSVFKLDSLLSNVGMISSKVVSGGLDTLEGLGKKTMNILQDTDPNIKNKLLSMNPSNSRPNLSELLKEAKNSDTCSELNGQETKITLQSLDHLLEDYCGLVYFEALDILSKQSKMKIELLLKPLTGKSLLEVQETLKEVEELCELPDDSDGTNDKITTDSLNEHLTKAVEDLNISVNFKEIVSYSEELNKWLGEFKEIDHDSTFVYNKSIEALAKVCSLSLNNYQKMAELMLSLSHRSTADEVDAVIQLTTVYFSLFNHIATVFSEKITKSKPCDSNKNLSTEVFIECSNAISYVKKAFNVFIPILQIGAL